MRISRGSQPVKRVPAGFRPSLRAWQTDGRRACAWPVLTWMAVLLFGVLTACTPTVEPEAGPPTMIEDSRDLMRALLSSGATVRESEQLAMPNYGVPGRVIQVGEELVHLYEYESVRAREETSAGIGPDGMSVGGRAVSWPVPPGIWASGKVIVIYPGTDGGTTLLLMALLGDPLTLDPDVVDEPYPPAILAVIEEAASLLEAPPAAIQVLDLQETVWPDACLGLPGTGEKCPKGSVAGWAVHVRGEEGEARFRTDQTGQIVRLEEVMRDR